MFRVLFLALLAALALTMSSHSLVQAADPTSSPASVATPAPSPLLIDPLDPRAGEGANRVGAPLLAILFVVGVGVVTVFATFMFVRVTRRA